MTFTEQNMASIPGSYPLRAPTPSRPATFHVEPKEPPSGAPILGNEGDQASVHAQPKVQSPDRISPAAMSGDETMGIAEPRVAASRRKSSRKGSSQAKVLAKPNYVMPDCNNPAEAGRDEASDQPKPTTAKPRHESISDGHSRYETQTEIAVAGDQRAHNQSDTPLIASPLIAEIIQLVRMRRRWHKAEKSLTLQGKALCRSWAGGDKDEANASYTRAAAGKPDDPFLGIALAPFLEAKARFEAEREAIDKALAKMAKTLPVWKAWAEGVKGLGALRLAVIVGECGDIGSYRNPSCLWKRMGLAVIAGGRQRMVANAADALDHGYNPERRAIAYVMSTELLKAQIRNVKDEDGKRTDTSIAIGAYGQLYLDRKAYEAGREGITKAHANNRAGRYMAKRVLRDLYAAWRAAPEPDLTT